jgi:hypothetical protein
VQAHRVNGLDVTTVKIGREKDCRAQAQLRNWELPGQAPTAIRRTVASAKEDWRVDDTDDADARTEGGQFWHFHFHFPE